MRTKYHTRMRKKTQCKKKKTRTVRRHKGGKSYTVEVKGKNISKIPTRTFTVEL